MDINNQFYIEIIESLYKNEVDFILIGGLAVAYYGYHRYTGDMDLWLKPSNHNLDDLYNALATDLEFDHDSISKIAQNRPIDDGTPIRLFSDDDTFKIDLLTNTYQKLFTWEECKEQSQLMELGNAKVAVVHINHLIAMKESSKPLDAKMKDLVDAEELKKIIKLKDQGSN